MGGVDAEFGEGGVYYSACFVTNSKFIHSKFIFYSFYVLLGQPYTFVDPVLWITVGQAKRLQKIKFCLK